MPPTHRHSVLCEHFYTFVLDQCRPAHLDCLKIARLYQLVDARAAEAGDPYRGGYANRERLQLLLPSALNHFCLRRAVARERTKLRSLSRKAASIAGINSTIGSSTP